MVEPLVSVIIPFYNPNNDFLKEALDSVRAQTYKRIEIILVNDGSENLVNIPNKKRQVYSIPHSGVATAVNVGVKKAHGEFFLRLDADDKLDSTYVEECLKPFVDPHVGLVWTGSIVFGEAAKFLSHYTVNIIRHPKKKLRHRFSVLENLGGQCGAALIRRSAFVQMGGYDKNLEVAEDKDLAIRLWFAGWRLVGIDKPLHFYRFHGGNQRHTGANSFKVLSKKYPLMIPYNYLSRTLKFMQLSFKHPVEALRRLGVKFI